MASSYFSAFDAPTTSSGRATVRLPARVLVKDINPVAVIRVRGGSPTLAARCSSRHWTKSTATSCGRATAPRPARCLQGHLRRLARRPSERARRRGRHVVLSPPTTGLADRMSCGRATAPQRGPSSSRTSCRTASAPSADASTISPTSTASPIRRNDGIHGMNDGKRRHCCWHRRSSRKCLAPAPSASIPSVMNAGGSLLFSTADGVTAGCGRAMERRRNCSPPENPT